MVERVDPAHLVEHLRVALKRNKNLNGVDFGLQAGTQYSYMRTNSVGALTKLTALGVYVMNYMGMVQQHDWRIWLDEPDRNIHHTCTLPREQLAAFAEKKWVEIITLFVGEICADINSRVDELIHERDAKRRKTHEDDSNAKLAEKDRLLQEEIARHAATQRDNAAALDLVTAELTASKALCETKQEKIDELTGILATEVRHINSNVNGMTTAIISAPSGGGGGIGAGFVSAETTDKIQKLEVDNGLLERKVQELEARVTAAVEEDNVKTKCIGDLTDEKDQLTNLLQISKDNVEDLEKVVEGLRDALEREKRAREIAEQGEAHVDQVRAALQIDMETVADDLTRARTELQSVGLARDNLQKNVNDLEESSRDLAKRLREATALANAAQEPLQKLTTVLAGQSISVDGQTAVDVCNSFNEALGVTWSNFLNSDRTDIQKETCKQAVKDCCETTASTLMGWWRGMVSYVKSLDMNAECNKVVYEQQCSLLKDALFANLISANHPFGNAFSGMISITLGIRNQIFQCHMQTAIQVFEGLSLQGLLDIPDDIFSLPDSDTIFTCQKGLKFCDSFRAYAPRAESWGYMGAMRDALTDDEDLKSFFCKYCKAERATRVFSGALLQSFVHLLQGISNVSLSAVTGAAPTVALASVLDVFSWLKDVVVHVHGLDPDNMGKDMCVRPDILSKMWTVVGNNVHCLVSAHQALKTISPMPLAVCLSARFYKSVRSVLSTTMWVSTTAEQLQLYVGLLTAQDAKGFLGSAASVQIPGCFPGNDGTLVRWELSREEINTLL